MSLHNDQNLKEIETLKGRITSRDEEIDLIKMKCKGMVDEIGYVRTRKADLEDVVNNLIEEINNLSGEDERCRRL